MTEAILMGNVGAPEHIGSGGIKKSGREVETQANSAVNGIWD